MAVGFVAVARAAARRAALTTTNEETMKKPNETNPTKLSTESRKGTRQNAKRKPKEGSQKKSNKYGVPKGTAGGAGDQACSLGTKRNDQITLMLLPFRLMLLAS